MDTHSSGYLTTNAGSPIDNMRVSETIGPRGPTLLQDSLLLENLQIQNRERVPERVVHARGIVAKGHFTVTQSLSDLTFADFVQKKGQKTPLAIRFSTVIHGTHSPEFLRDPRGFAIKLYTRQGNYDIVANNWPVFFIKDGIRFPDAVRALKPNPKTANQEWWRIWDYFSNFPESTNAFSFLLDDIGIPRNFRTMDGFSINTYKMVNSEGKERLFRWHFRSQLGEKGFEDDQEASSQHFSFATKDLMDSIKNGEYPRFTVEVQTMDPSNLPTDFDALDATKEWPVDRFPFREVGEIVLDENINSFFLESESIAFAVSRMVPGIQASDDKLLQSRLFSYVDTQRYRLGVNNQMLPINIPRCPFTDNHMDGAMNFNMASKSAREVNFFPSLSDKNIVEAAPYPHENELVEGRKGRIDQIAPDEFKQPGDRWRSFDPARQERFAERVSVSLTAPRVSQEMRDIWIGNWTKVDPKLGEMVKENINLLMKAEEMGSFSSGEKKKVEKLMHRKKYMQLTGAA